MKSPPEIWAEVSDVSILARHLGEFGEIRITRLEAETTVVWEGDRARGTVELESSGWGTKVTITAEALATDDAEEAEIVEAEPVEVDVVEDVAEPVVSESRRRFFARLRLRRRVIEPEPVIVEPEPEITEPEPVAEITEPVLDGEIVATAAAATAAFDPEQVEAVLIGVLDDLGSAHHRPFSRG